jgi:trans-aconitate methyltransferase
MSPQTWNPRAYARDAGFVAALGEPLIALLAPRPGERVLDLGCGDGALTEKLVAHGCRVVGIDSSPEQVEAARARGLDAHVGDAAALAFEGEFDAVLSNATLHWVPDFAATLRGVHRALVPGGRFVVECGGEGNLSAIRSALTAALARRGIDARAYDPWTFRGVDEARAALAAAGFTAREVTLFARPTPLAAGMGAWLSVFARSYLGGLPSEEHKGFLAEVRDALASTLRDERGAWTADYVRLRFVAIKA